MRIGIDIDDTLTNTGIIENKYKKQYELEFGKVYTSTEHDNFWTHYGARIYSEAEFKPGAKAALDALKAWGYEIILITAREYFASYDIEQLTENKLKANNIVYDQIIYNSNPKGDDAIKTGVGLFVDDLDYNLESVASKGIDCIKFVQKYQNGKYRQFNDWADLLLYIKLWGKEYYGKQDYN